MFRSVTKSSLVRSSRRNFTSSARVMNDIYGTPKSGPYSNLPFKVRGTVIPFGVKFFGILGFFFAFPFLTTYWHLKKAGSFDM